MEVSLKSSAGRSFAATFDPITVSVLLSLATVSAEARLRREVLTDLEALRKENLNVNNEYVVTLDDENRGVVDKYSDKYLPVQDSFAPSAMGAFQEFLNEFKLLQAGSGSERACMESFYSLCELLQG